MRKTKIIATLGPASERLVGNLSRYVDVFRVNMAHGTQESRRKYVELVRTTKAALLMDLPGPKLRVGDIKGMVKLRRGQTVVFSKKGEGIPVTEDLFYRSLKEGSVVLLADGIIRVRVKSVTPEEVKATVVDGGILTSRKGINIPDLKTAPGLTETDLEMLKEANTLGADMIGLSFIMSPKEVQEAKGLTKSFIVGKIEKKGSLKELEGIVKEADAIMVARGDLGVEVGLEMLPLVQEKVIRTARTYGKPVILATQVFESMMSSPTPTRAEVVDVANSIIKGVDAIMLSDETAIGSNPLRAAFYLDRTIRKLEKVVRPNGIRPADVGDAIAYSAVDAANLSGARAIVAHGGEGNAALKVAKFRPRVPIVTLVSQGAQRFKTVWGTIPVQVNGGEGDMSSFIDSKLKELKICRSGDVVIIVSSEEGTAEADVMKIHKVK
ncbi:pyruvate kinase [Sulfodiicoccus acidiphilus]|uniref:Pyruvate kinase n=1 Tax=Sulfodiicoccus acidiphilus TaxID=1670455 RepID=A0A348B2J5_9CREN|nr:pyruvate kinase [Sulfodiicoccus acidiphilus]BBD72397.1 pyruvate kinase [Sulfodiicoccus acidiphilus]GGT97420.1 pyruvate kinase [Sulfodiicoccus acidiphilus]